MDHKIGRSAAKPVNAAIDTACQGMTEPKFVWFTTAVDAFKETTEKLHQRFPRSIVMGTTSIAAFSHEGIFHDTLEVLAVQSGVECVADVLEEADHCPLKYVGRVQDAVRSFGHHGSGDTICLTATNGLIACEESVLAVLNSVLRKERIPVFGGTAGDRGLAEKTYVSLNGKVYDKACIFVILRNLGGRIHLYRENIYKPICDPLTATQVDAFSRKVMGYDGSAAAEMEARMHGISVSQMNRNFLDSNPVGRIIGKDMYIIANDDIDSDHRSMKYHARIYENDQIVMLQPDDYRQVNRQTMERIHHDVPHPSMSIMVNCLARTLLFESEGYADEFFQSMGRVLGSYVGWGGYGEQIYEQHFNQTMIAAVFE
ncbi:hypothetical protein SELR_19600 [Selenomonas ruminantium subsp. lactilytica TAM6421]|uniref:FIST domain-containing protein n=1 Tax=Selenomonas ruminantium subsp. lactilytica (strain NBRC 103574 / TAM6421) TaxID=927704 RepID=I0GSD1_SELRL|nr:FIST N-terminal domain-containing protein [Selenomonas ruminantium]BAL83668.1 hypothetical protein SELR_19600 [Selenomonas ruminantium subsp. lactilytica TAM6421]